ncbi:transcription factor Ouib-like [Teleopsis dalmanni]|uniref:transcription factor Ouib-like n=1 Tax=Teleopsis dalmanni TaxID=139649 RepID=UPI0018CE5D69|nr:transcription factor Ouib-like [Teleopsis dalmanni]
MLIKNLCRICITENINVEKMIPLFDNTITNYGDVTNHIKECSGVLITPQNGYPNKICLQCFNLLKLSLKFRRLCVASENTLRKRLVNGVLISPISPDLFTSQDTNQVEHKNKLDTDFDYEFNFNMNADKYEDQNNPKRTSSNALHVSTSGLNSKIKKKGGTNKDFTYICEVCGNKYKKAGLLNLHMRIHTREKAYECEICKKKFDFSSSKSRHMRTHTKEKPYSCKHCNRRFADHSTFIKHERTHTNTRPFTCKTCGKAFSYSNVLKSHMLIHTGEKSFQCKVCNKCFSRKHELTQHFNTIIHKEAEENINKPNPLL